MVSRRIGFILINGVSIGTAIYYCLNKDNYEHEHNQYGNFIHRPVLYLKLPLLQQLKQKSTLPKKDQKRCPICFEYLIDNVRHLSCNHSFHDNCINKLFDKLKNTDCPLCGVTDSILECMICLEPIYSDVMKLKCNHSFHRTCIKTWLQQSRSCPLRCSRAI